MGFEFPVISADSHITESPDTYSKYIDSAWRDKAPRLVNAGAKGDLFVIDGMERPIAMGLVAAAGKKPEEITESGVTFAQLHRGGWDPVARLQDQDRDGVAAEIIYPTVGMLLCNHRDFAYKEACFAAYNRWIAEYCAHAPARLLGCGQTAATDPSTTVADLRAMKALGLRGVMMSGNPGTEDFDSPLWNPVWETAIELKLPVSFHILTTRGGSAVRGPRLNSFMAIIRGNQDILGTLIFGGVFERYPDLQVCCVEADAGWIPHYLYRMDHAYTRHRNWLGQGVELSRLPSEYFRDHIYTTFQDDWVAFKCANDMNWRRLMWANDFPHSDSTWPDSQAMLAQQTHALTPEQTRAILSDNVAQLYGIDTSTLTRAA